ncbi:phage tail protein [Leptospira interrogans]
MAGPTPMSLGGHAFRALGFSLTDLSRNLQTPWSELEVAARFDALHWTGPKSETVSIRGVLFPEEWGGLSTLERLRSSAAAGSVMSLVTGGGQILGRYVLVSISEDRSFLDARGVPRRDAYTLELKLYTQTGIGRLF